MPIPAITKPLDLDIPILWGYDEMATYYGVSRKTVRNWRAAGDPLLPPATVVTGNGPRWDPWAAREYVLARGEKRR